MSEAKTHKGLIYKVAVPSPLRRLFDYLPPASYKKSASGEKIDKQIKAGTRVKIPFGRRTVIGFVVESARETTVASTKLKSIIEVLDSEPTFTQKHFKLLLWCAQYYQHPIGEVLSAAVPTRLRSARPLYQQEAYLRATSDNVDSLNRAPKQKQLLQEILSAGEIEKSVLQEKGFTSAQLTSLVDKQLIENYTKTAAKKPSFSALHPENKKALELNLQQQDALTKIRKAETSFKCFLLDGVTGSGKTEVYMQAMQDHLSKGRQCLVLVPEIGLTPQTISRFEERFECLTVALHSGMSDNDRLQAWSNARDGAAGIVIGTRSAIFTPLPKLGLIVVDEEHDSSFKQQDGFRYSARDIAVMRGREEKVPVILGSATPSLESVYNTQQNKFTHLLLSQRAGGARNASMSVVDTSKEMLDSGFSEQLLFKIEQHLKNGNQTLVFINRRGFAPILNCDRCGWTAECENCISQLTVHSKPPSMRCHHCGLSVRLPKQCPDCENDELSAIGIGTQKLENFLNARFAKFPVIRIDRDSTRRKKSFGAMLEQINTGSPGILLGTQMLAKGHHFPFVTLVAIVDADAGLFSPDFRGQEFMAQTVIQVAGRAGRAEREGEVIIQSRHATHQALQQLSQSGYRNLVANLMNERKTAAMPPYTQLALIKAEGAQLRKTLEILEQISRCSDQIINQSNSGINSIGPMPAPMEKRAGRYRSHLLFKASSKAVMQGFLAKLVERIDQIKMPNGLRWSLDVDPQEMI